MKLIAIVSVCLLSSFTVLSQKNVFITIAQKVGGNDIQMNTNTVNLTGVAFNLDHFDYYLSNLHIIHDGGQDLDLSDTVFLVEPDNHVLYLGFLNVTTIEQVSFGTGVPPNLNTVNGADVIDIAAYPAGHPLSFQDPSMHWGWTAGYMHMIIGGMADSNADGIIDYTFELHNVGDNNYRYTQFPVVQTNTSMDQIDVYINCNVDVWMKGIPIETVGILHGSTGYNTEIMKNVEIENVFDQSATASVPMVQTTVGRLFFSTVNSKVTVSWEEVINAATYSLTDLSGKIISNGFVEGINGNLEFANLTNGLYNFQIFDSNSNQLNMLKVVK